MEWGVFPKLFPLFMQSIPPNSPSPLYFSANLWYILTKTIIFTGVFGSMKDDFYGSSCHAKGQVADPQYNAQIWTDWSGDTAGEEALWCFRSFALLARLRHANLFGQKAPAEKGEGRVGPAELVYGRKRTSWWYFWTSWERDGSSYTQRAAIRKGQVYRRRAQAGTAQLFEFYEVALFARVPNAVVMTSWNGRRSPWHQPYSGAHHAVSGAVVAEICEDVGKRPPER